MKRSEARALIYDTFLATWNDPLVGWRSVACMAGGGPLVEEPKIYWDNVQVPDNPPVDKPHLEIYVRHQDGEQTTMGEPGCRRFSREGLVEVRIWVPEDGGLTLADDLVTVAVTAFEGRTALLSGEEIWFRNVRAPETGPNKTKYRVSVLADFEYDEVK